MKIKISGKVYLITKLVNELKSMAKVEKVVYAESFQYANFDSLEEIQILIAGDTINLGIFRTNRYKRITVDIDTSDFRLLKNSGCNKFNIINKVEVVERLPLFDFLDTEEEMSLNDYDTLELYELKLAKIF